jgi:hypothetical protein
MGVFILDWLFGPQFPAEKTEHAAPLRSDREEAGFNQLPSRCNAINCRGNVHD